MIWGFLNNLDNELERQKQEVIGIFDEAVDFARDQWLIQYDSLRLGHYDTLAGKFLAFLAPGISSLRYMFSDLETAHSALLIWIIVLGIIKSGTHTESQVDAMIDEVDLSAFAFETW